MKGGGFSEMNRKRMTFESRIGDNGICLNPMSAKCWTKFFIYFMELCIKKGLPSPYKTGKPWSGLCWLEADEVYEFLEFDQPLSPGMEQVRDWFIYRLYSYSLSGNNHPFWGKARGRSFDFACSKIKDVNSDNFSPNVSDELLFGEKYAN
jgi:hypothetical protein